MRKINGKKGEPGEIWGVTAARVPLPRFFLESSTFCLAGFERIKMVNDRSINGCFGGT